MILDSSNGLLSTPHKEKVMKPKEKLASDIKKFQDLLDVIQTDNLLNEEA
ncbi:hypothetical protein AALP_AAs65352U000100 [Arabis alpina]|uniref:Uncharacterized protein n=1 Tax=Arabis alpina TaxID=50452 RepID=A0A087G346_ARAAL|nr:hypothetical protein AALP_AAs65352U000100 [Arabis alpina]